ncbi:MAG: TIGR02996 domain-containing protein [Myxococcales bacterium]
MLSDLLRLLANQDYPVALEAALEAWRLKPTAELARVISAVAARVPIPEDAATTLDELVAAPEARTLPLALRLVESSPNSPAMKKNLDLLFAAWPADPRLTELLFAFFEHPAWDVASGNAAKLAERVVGLLAASKDARVGPWVAALPAFFEAHKGSRKGQLSKDEIATLEGLFGAARFPKLDLLLGHAERRDLDAITTELARLARGKASEEEERSRLLQLVIDRWDSDEPKQVYADWLQERGDPQGELIALELRPGARTAEIKARLQELTREVQARLKVPGATLEKGFPRVVAVRNGEGTFEGAWDERQVWGTVAEADIPPTSDACHTENLRTLRVGLTYLKDLAKLTRPLKVTCFGIFNASDAARPTLKKLQALSTIETLELLSPSTRDFGWVFTIPALSQVRHVLLTPGPYVTSPHLVAAKAYFSAPALQEVQLDQQIRLRRGPGQGPILALEAKDSVAVQNLRLALAEVPRPFVDRVEIASPATDLADLLPLGREHAILATESVAAQRAKTELEDGWLVVTPDRQDSLLDPDAFRAVASPWKGKASKVRLVRSAKLDLLPRYLSLCDELGFGEASIHGHLHYNPYTVVRTADGWLEWALPQYVDLRPALAGLAHAKVRLRCSPNVQPTRHAEELRKAGCTVEIVEDLSVLANQFAVKFVKSARRLELSAKGYGPTMATPELADLLLSRESGRPFDELLDHRSENLARGPLRAVARVALQAQPPGDVPDRGRQGGQRLHSWPGGAGGPAADEPPDVRRGQLGPDPRDRPRWPAREAHGRSVGRDA